MIASLPVERRWGGAVWTTRDRRWRMQVFSWRGSGRADHQRVELTGDLANGRRVQGSLVQEYLGRRRRVGASLRGGDGRNSGRRLLRRRIGTDWRCGLRR